MLHRASVSLEQLFVLPIAAVARISQTGLERMYHRLEHVYQARNNVERTCRSASRAGERVRPAVQLDVIVNNVSMDLACRACRDYKAYLERLFLQFMSLPMGKGDAER